ncbi:MAG: RluA family pseudouridine synthase [Proteobacteria bacterium]|nr:RluA family pseudouridine synthase [Pseudomonadota bacterium]
MTLNQPSSPFFQATVSEHHHGKRLDVWLTGELGDFSRSEILTAIDQQQFFVGVKKAKPSTLLKAGDVVCGFGDGFCRHSERVWEPAYLPLDILYEDHALLVVNKPSGVVSHPGIGTVEVTLIEGVMHYLDMAVNPVGASERYGLVHRLDRDTTGALVIGKTSAAYHWLKRLLEARKIQRKYVAILDGCLAENRVTFGSYLTRSAKDRTRFESFATPVIEGRYPKEIPKKYRFAQTEFIREVSIAGRFDLCTLRLTTGRTHQIRVHAQSLGVPILGDQTYCAPSKRRRKWQKKTGSQLDVCSFAQFCQDIGQAQLPLERQLLHSRVIGFVHPDQGGYLKVVAPLPHDFRAVITTLKPYLS